MYTTAVFHEALRLFPTVVRLSKQVLSDTHIKARRFATSHDGTVRNVEEYIVPIEGGSTIIIDIAALHMNREVLHHECMVSNAAFSDPLG